MPAHADHPIAAPTGERLASAAILAALALVAAGLLAAQSRLHPALIERAKADQASPAPAATGGSLLGERLPDSIVAFSAPESFDAATLSDKINGRAELYLASGFVGMQCQRLAPAEQPEAWFELFVYSMGSPIQAYAVFSQQRRADAQDLDWTTHAYATSDSLFVAVGPHYLEAIASDASPAVLDAMRGAVRSWLAGQAPDTPPAALARFPSALFSNDRESFQLRDAFGCADLTEVYIAPTLDDRFFAFLSERASEEEARALRDAYLRHLGALGARPVDTPDPFKAVKLYGVTEVVFTRGALLAGIHEAEDPGQALDAARILHDHLGAQP